MEEGGSIMKESETEEDIPKAGKERDSRRLWTGMAGSR